MARIHRAVSALAIACALAAPAGAQALQHLHVRSMTLAADAPRVRLTDMLRLVLRVHVDERVRRLDNVTLGDLSGFDVLGDERRCIPARAGTDCSETLSLAPSAVGKRTLGPIYLDAADARTSRPARFGSNVVTVTVIPSSLQNASTGLWQSFRGALDAAGVAGLVVFAGLVLLLAFRRRARPAFPEPRPPVAVPQAPPDTEARWLQMIERLRARPSRARVIAVRAVLRTRVGARPDETFADLAARGAHLEEPSAMEALRLIERAAFVDELHLANAVLDAMPALESVAGMRRVGA